MKRILLTRFIQIFVFSVFQMMLSVQLCWGQNQTAARQQVINVHPAANDPTFNTSDTIKAANGSYFAVPITNTKSPSQGSGIKSQNAITQTSTVVAIPQQPANDISPNYVAELRKMILGLQKEQHENTKDMGWFKKTNIEFVPQSIAFFLAHGMVIYEEAWRTSGGDPLEMEKHILSLKDPVAQFSMYTFMQATGFYVHFSANRLRANIDDLTRMRMMRRFSYQGLAFGSLVSSLVTDVFAPIGTCLKAQFNGDKRFIQKYNEECIMGLSASWSQWTYKNKFNQYTPQIISALIGQGVSEVIEIGAVTSAKALSAKIPWQKIATAALKKEFFSASKIVVNIAGFITPGVGQAKTFMFLGSVLKAVNFIGAGIILTPYIYRPVNNIILPFEFTLDANMLNTYLNSADRMNWDKNNDSRVLPPAVNRSKEDYQIHQRILEQPTKNVNSVKLTEINNKIENLPHEIDNFTEVVQAWRAHLNMKNEEHLANWLEFTTKILNQVGLAHKFYKTYIQNLYKTLAIEQSIKAGAATKESKANNNFFPYRQFPLYGVSYPLDVLNKASETAETKIQNNLQAKQVINDYYMDTPQHMEQYQMQTVAKSVEMIKQLKAKYEFATDKNERLVFSAQAQKDFQEIMTLLSSKDTNVVAQGLVKINTILELYGKRPADYMYQIRDPDFYQLIKLLRLSLGDPYPILQRGLGFAQAFDMHSTTQELSTKAAFPLIEDAHSFTKDADYFLFQMLCGPSTGHLTENWLMSDNFVPPRVVRSGARALDMCDKNTSLVHSNNLYTLDFSPQKKSTVTSNQYNVTDYLVEYLDYSSIGSIDSEIQKFEDWWKVNVDQHTRSRFQKMDEDYNRLVIRTQDSIFGTSNGAGDSMLSNLGYALTHAADWLNFSRYLPKTIDLTLKWQLEVYLNILQSLTDNSMSAENKMKNKNYLEIALKNAELPEKRQDIFLKKSPLIEKLRQSYLTYLLQMRPDTDLSFAEYISLSSQIISLINDIKIQMGLAEKDVDSSTPDNTVLLVKSPQADQSLSLKQKVATSALNGLSLLEAEIKRFIRLRIQLSNTLDIEVEEFNKMISNSSEKNKKTKTYVPGKSY